PQRLGRVVDDRPHPEALPEVPGIGAAAEQDGLAVAHVFEELHRGGEGAVLPGFDEQHAGGGRVVERFELRPGAVHHPDPFAEQVLVAVTVLLPVPGGTHIVSVTPGVAATASRQASRPYSAPSPPTYSRCS